MSSNDRSDLFRRKYLKIFTEWLWYQAIAPPTLRCGSILRSNDAAAAHLGKQ
jgi:hypothetical protein